MDGWIDGGREGGRYRLSVRTNKVERKKEKKFFPSCVNLCEVGASDTEPWIRFLASSWGLRNIPLLCTSSLSRKCDGWSATLACVLVRSWTLTETTPIVRVSRPVHSDKTPSGTTW